MTAADAYLTALRLLTRADRSEADLAQRLRRKGFDEAQIKKALERCRELGYLDDRRLVLEQARRLASSGKAVGARLLLELEKKGFPRDMAQNAVQEAGRNLTEEELIEDLLGRRFPKFDPRHAEPREKRRVATFFQRRGYRLGTILSVFDRYSADRAD